MPILTCMAVLFMLLFHSDVSQVAVRRPACIFNLKPTHVEHKKFKKLVQAYS